MQTTKKRRAAIRTLIMAVSVLIVFLTALYAKDNVWALENDRTLDENIEKFPESYKEALYKIKEKHPNWKFIMVDTGLDWKTVMANETNPASRSLIPSYFPAEYVGAYYGDGWSCATEAAVEYYLDPRNWLDENYIFQFEMLTYNSDTQGIATVQKVLANTFMSGLIEGYDSITYAQAFYDIGQSCGVSPVHLAVRVYQEQGAKGNSDLISGKYPGYEGYYNYFNIQASGSTHEQIVRNGLNEAKAEGWNSRYVALRDGAYKLVNRYILRGQDTLYFQKFDVDATYDGMYWHQYMQNVCAPSNEGRNIKLAYEKAGLMDCEFTFKIPVFDNMPGTDNLTEYEGRDYADVYNKDYYYEHNPDLRAAIGNNPEALIEHFVNYGMSEGRQGSEEFNVDYYMDNYRDLRRIFQDDIATYYLHYILYGKEEKRVGNIRLESAVDSPGLTVYNGVDYSAVYNKTYYLENNPDLKNAIGDSNIKLIRHFVEYGMAEGRPSSESFNAKIYRNNYADLNRAFGDDLAAYFNHYMDDGIKEGRVGNKNINAEGFGYTIYDGKDYSLVYDKNYYLEHNGDVNRIIGDDAAALIEHFVRYGLMEGRRAKADFDVKAYRSKYKDLDSTFGDDWATYYYHYMYYGFAEGRTSEIDKPDDGDKPGDGTETENPDDGDKPGDGTETENPDDGDKPGDGTETENPDDGNKPGDETETENPDDGDKPGDDISYAVYDGVDYSLVYDKKFYLENNEDLQRVFGDDAEALIEHFVKYGMAEGRMASKSFDPYLYRARYEDLENAFGDDMKAYYLHYMKDGIAEERSGQ